MPRKPSGRPPGRPRKHAADEAAAKTRRGESTTADAASVAKVDPATIWRRNNEAAKAKPAVAPAPAKKSASAAPKDRRAAVVAALAAALDEAPALVESLPLDPAELRRRLEDVGLLEGDLDPLAILRRVQARLERDMSTLPPAAVVARKGVAGALVQLARGAEAIMQDRPPVGDSPEQIVARLISERRDAAVAKIFEHVREAESEAAA